MHSVQDLSDEMLVRFTQIDYSREIALIAVTTEQGGEVEIGVTRFAINPDGESCEFALVVADTMSGKGLGQKLMTALMDAARSKGLKTPWRMSAIWRKQRKKPRLTVNNFPLALTFLSGSS